MILGKASRDKGGRAEREWADYIDGERVPLSGAAGGSYTGDVVGLDMLWEVKRRANGMKMYYDILSDADIDGVAFRADRESWLVVMRASKFKAMREQVKRLQEELRQKGAV